MTSRRNFFAICRVTIPGRTLPTRNIRLFVRITRFLISIPFEARFACSAFNVTAFVAIGELGARFGWRRDLLAGLVVITKFEARVACSAFRFTALGAIGELGAIGFDRRLLLHASWLL